jgi:pyruvate/2-oxoglutarate dehydrogenase complex dihydrolipoamide acyltransferase (E2) component
MVEYRLISDHQEDLDNGAVVEPGGFIDLDDEEVKLDRAKSLLADGKLIAVEDSGIEITPEARKLARRAKVNLTAISGTGEKGRIVVSDVEAYIESQKEAEAQ